jgi:hypothetical protein
LGFAGIHQARRIGNKLARHHDVGQGIEELIALVGIGFSTET